MRYLFNSTIKLDLIDLCRNLFLIPITNEVENCVSQLTLMTFYT